MIWENHGEYRGVVYSRRYRRPNYTCPSQHKKKNGITLRRKSKFQFLSLAVFVSCAELSTKTKILKEKKPACLSALANSALARKILCLNFYVSIPYEAKQVQKSNLNKIVRYCDNLKDCRRALQLNYFNKTQVASQTKNKINKEKEHFKIRNMKLGANLPIIKAPNLSVLEFSGTIKTVGHLPYTYTGRPFNSDRTKDSKPWVFF